jgi:hypothetical protein
MFQKSMSFHAKIFHFLLGALKAGFDLLLLLVGFTGVFFPSPEEDS